MDMFPDVHKHVRNAQLNHKFNRQQFVISFPQQIDLISCIQSLLKTWHRTQINFAHKP